MDSCQLWATSGAMSLTGDPDGPPLYATALRLRELHTVAQRLGASLSVLSERAAAFGFTRQGSTTPGGATKLMQTADEYVAVCVARPEDEQALPALLHTDPAPDIDKWEFLQRHLPTVKADDLIAQAELLGIAASKIQEAGPVGFYVNEAALHDPASLILQNDMGDNDAPAQALGLSANLQLREVAAAPIVVDLTSLWAGPLCTHLLGRIGATVIKVESTTRPDGARSGAREFYNAVNANKYSVALDFSERHDRELLYRLIEHADIVVSSSRKRAFDQLDIDPHEVLTTRNNKIWAAISAHGWQRSRIGFGDDAAVAAGAVAWGSDGQPRFLGDALADSVCGILLAGTIATLWNSGGQHFIDAPLSGAVRSIWDTRLGRKEAITADQCNGVVIADPQQPLVSINAAELGADTNMVMNTLITKNSERSPRG